MHEDEETKTGLAGLTASQREEAMARSVISVFLGYHRHFDVASQTFQFFPFMGIRSHAGMKRESGHLAHHASELFVRIAGGKTWTNFLVSTPESVKQDLCAKELYN